MTRGRQYETETVGLPPEPVRQPVPGPKPFNLMLRRPGGRDIYLSPTFDDPSEYLRRDGLYEGTDERDDRDTDWSLSLPHRCGEWGIWDGTREDVLEAALRFRDELDQAIAALEDAEEPGSHAAEWTLPFPPHDLTDMKTWPAPLPLAAQIARPEPRAWQYPVGGPLPDSADDRPVTVSVRWLNDDGSLVDTTQNAAVRGPYLHAILAAYADRGLTAEIRIEPAKAADGA